MRPDAFQATLQIAEEIVQQLYRAFGPRRRQKLQQALATIKSLVGPEAMPYLQVHIGALDRKRGQVLVFQTIDVSYCDDQQLFILGREPTPRTFLVDGESLAVPEDRCPKCLGLWQIDPRDPKPCPHCGAALGKDVWLVAAQGICPFCAAARTVQSTTPCDCGFDWNPAFVKWT
jgi:hypothetical protein